MPYIQVQDIRLGMDRKRASRVVAELGSAWTIKNAHLTRGGDIQRRKKFVKQNGSFPSTTHGLYAINETLFTNGYSAAQAGNVPSGVTHLLTQHPTPATAISRVLDATGFDGTLYSIIEFTDGNIYHYYGTTRVTDWDTLATTIGSNDAVAAALAAAIDKSSAVNATSAGSVVTITSETAGTAFTISKSTVNNGVSPQTEVLATGDIQVTGGTSSPGVNRITSITVNGVEILDTAVDWTTSNDATAAALKTQIDAFTSSPEYTTSVVTDTLTLTALAGTGSDPNGYVIVVTTEGDVTVTADGSMAGGVDQVDDETITLNETQVNVVAGSEVVATASIEVTGGTESSSVNNSVYAITIDGVDIMGGPAEVLSEGSFTITGGTSNPGTNTIDQVLVNGVDVLGATIDHDGDNSTTAATVAAQITSNTSSPNYTASAVGAVVTITAIAGTGSSPNGYTVSVNKSGDVTTGSETAFSGGDYYGVQWNTSNSQTASDIKDQINANTSSPNYTATVDGPVITISAASGTGSTPNGFTVAVGVTGDVTTAGDTEMSGGTASSSAVAQVYTATIGGTFEAADQFTITINGTEVYTVTGGASGTGTSILTFKQKLYSTASSNLYFSALNSPTKWISGIDYGFINMASQTAGQETLTVAQEYQGLVAVFSENNIRVWSISESSDANVFLQTLQNTGTIAPESVVPYGNNDVFYLDTSGIRSIKARDSSNAAYVSDVGTPIDTHIRDYLDTLTEAEIQGAVGIVEPIDGRFWLGIKNRIYVLSYFPSAKISAWSYYEVDFDVKAFAKVGDRIYVRGTEDGTDYLYLYGGESNTTYGNAGEDIVTVELPYFSANDPAGKKQLLGFDIIGINSWKVDILPDPADETVVEPQGIATGVTYGKERYGLNGISPLFAVNLTCSEAGPATLSALAMHYEGTFDSG